MNTPEVPTKDTLPFTLTIQNCRDALQNVGKLLREAEQDVRTQNQNLPGILEALKEEERAIITQRQQTNSEFPEYGWRKDALSILTQAAINPAKSMEEVERFRQKYFAKIQEGEEKTKAKEDGNRRLVSIGHEMQAHKDSLGESERKVKKLKHEMTRIQRELDYRLSLLQPPLNDIP